MYITCPSCSTSYEVDGTQIGPQGRTVRCFNCHHSWQQYPVAAQPPVQPRGPILQPPRYVPQSQQGYAHQHYAQPVYAEPVYMPDRDYARGYPPPPPSYGPPQHPAYAMPAAPPAHARQPERYEPEPDFEPEPEPMPRPQPRPEPVKAAPKPAPKPAPEPIMEEDLPSDEELDKMLGPVRDDAASRAFGSGGGAAKDDTTNLDEDKIAKIPDPEPLRQVYGGKAADDDDEDLDDDIEPDDIPDPDPIPTVYGGADDDEDDDIEEKGGGLKMLIAPAVTMVALGAIFAGIVLAREPIVKFLPAANDYFFDLLGLHVMLPGEGLKRELTRTAMETVADVDHVIATGMITNVSDKEQPLPQVIVQLIDANEKVLNSKTVTLEKPSLAPGEVLQFKAVFDGAPATARKVRTEWGEFVSAASAPMAK